MRFLRTILAGQRSPTIARDWLNGLLVSTANSLDYGPETALLDQSGVYPVERYETREEALTGHQRWVEFARTAAKGTQIRKIGPEEARDWDEDITLEPWESENPYSMEVIE